MNHAAAAAEAAPITRPRRQRPKRSVMGFHDEMRQEGHHRRHDYEDFADRYDRGQPHVGYDDDEVGRRYHEVAGNVDENTYRESARGAFERMDPDQRRQFGQLLHEHARGSGHDSGYDGSSDDPQGLAEMTTRVHQQNPGLLGQLLGAAGGGGGGLSGLVGGGGGGGGALVSAYHLTSLARYDLTS